MSGWMGSLLDMLSMRVHFESLMRGVVDSKDLVYFASIIFIGLTLSELFITKRA